MNFLKNIFYSLSILLYKAQKSGVIITYHTISDMPIYNAITPLMFDKQMKILKDKNFNVVSLSELMRLEKENSVPQKTVAITFDDGYLDNFEQAFPILKKYNFPATIFIITSSIGGDWINKQTHFKMCTNENLIEMHKSGLINIEPHTHNHPKLATVAKNIAQEEISKSKKYLENLLNKTCVHLAYPKGDFSEETIEAAKLAGIEYAYSTNEGFVSTTPHDFKICRNGTNNTMTLIQYEGMCLWGRLSRKRFTNWLWKK